MVYNFHDFHVYWDSKTESLDTLTRRIVYSIFIHNRIKADKPCVLGLFGGSGEGKSLTALALYCFILSLMNLDLKKNFEVSNIITPIQYAKKIDKLLYDKEYKDNCVAIVHEAREVIRAKLWHSFLNQCIGDVNAMSRTIKPLMLILVSQFVGDIDKSVRSTMTYYLTVTRSKSRKVKLNIQKLYFDDRDIERPVLKKRRVHGYVISPTGKHRSFYLPPIEIDKPPKELSDIFKKMDFEGKTILVRRKLEKLVKQIEQETGEDNKKIETMVTWYVRNPEQLDLIGKKTKKGFSIRDDITKMHDLTESEKKDFQNKLSEELIKNKLIENIPMRDESNA